VILGTRPPADGSGNAALSDGVRGVIVSDVFADVDGEGDPVMTRLDTPPDVIGVLARAPSNEATNSSTSSGRQLTGWVNISRSVLNSVLNNDMHLVRATPVPHSRHRRIYSLSSN
jgi:hypothetical protein